MSEQGRLSRLLLGTPKLEDRCPVIFSGGSRRALCDMDLRACAFHEMCCPAFCFFMRTLYGSFGLASPFLPAFLAARGVAPEALGLLLGAGTAVRLLSAPLAGRACGCFRRLPVRAHPLCNFSSPGIASLFTRAFILDAGFGEPDPGCHAGAARSPVRCARAFLVSFELTQRLWSVRIWLGARHRLRRLHCRSARCWTSGGRFRAGFSYLVHCRVSSRSSIVGAIGA